jgi:cytochrome c-type biogenesis protein CcmH/NrfG
LKAPGLALLAARMGECERRLGDYRQAELALKRAISIAGPVPELYDELGEIYVSMKKPRPAAEALEMAAGLDGGSAGRWIKSARALEAAGLAAAARDSARRALECDPGNTDALALKKRLFAKP